MYQHNTVVRSVTLFVIYSLIAVFVGVGTPLSVQSQVPSAAQPVNGILEAKGSVTVNGIDAVSGATVFSDSRIETKANSSASVNFPGRAIVDVGCSSAIKISFDSYSVDVTVFSGYARLTGYQGTKGTLMWSGGKPSKTDSSMTSSSVDSGVPNVCGPVGTSPIPAAGSNGGLWGLGSLGTALLFGGVGLGIVAIALIRRDPRCDQLPPAVSNIRPCRQ